jgi:hypothetical protein
MIRHMSSVKLQLSGMSRVECCKHCSCYLLPEDGNCNAARPRKPKLYIELQPRKPKGQECKMLFDIF